MKASGQLSAVVAILAAVRI